MWLLLFPPAAALAVLAGFGIGEVEEMIGAPRWVGSFLGMLATICLGGLYVLAVTGCG